MALCRFLQHTLLPGLLTALALSGLPGPAFAANRAGSPNAAPRIVDAVDETKLVTLAGRPIPAAKYDQGAVDDSLLMEHMFLQLRRSPEQEKALDQLSRAFKIHTPAATINGSPPIRWARISARLRRTSTLLSDG